jgi:hypothetical protein
MREKTYSKVHSGKSSVSGVTISSYIRTYYKMAAIPDDASLAIDKPNRVLFVASKTRTDYDDKEVSSSRKCQVLSPKTSAFFRQHH